MSKSSFFVFLTDCNLQTFILNVFRTRDSAEKYAQNLRMFKHGCKITVQECSKVPKKFSEEEVKENA